MCKKITNQPGNLNPILLRHNESLEGKSTDLQCRVHCFLLSSTMGWGFSLFSLFLIMCVCVCRCPHSPEQGFRFPEAGVIHSWKLPDRDAEKWPQVLQKQYAILTNKPSPQLPTGFLLVVVGVLLVGITFITRKLFILKKATLGSKSSFLVKELQKHTHWALFPLLSSSMIPGTAFPAARLISLKGNH